MFVCALSSNKRRKHGVTLATPRRAPRFRSIRVNVALVTGTVDTDSPSCAKTLGLTFSCQAAAAAATSAASRAQRSTIMALVTSRHHLYWDTRGARLCVEQAGGARGGRRRTGGPGGAGGAPARTAPRGLACVGLRSADLARDATLLTPAPSTPTATS